MEIKMNQRGNYISKGVYLHPQTAGFVTVKQYIFCRQRGKKCLIIKFSNNCDFKVSAMNFTVIQLDAAGELIRKTPVSYNALSVSQGSDFSVNSGIIVDEKCCDFKIVIDEVFSGYFKYVIRNGTPVAYYEKRGNLTVEGGKKISGFIHTSFAKERKTKTSRLACFAAVLAVSTVLLLNVFNTAANMQKAIDAGTRNDAPSYGESGSADNSFSTQESFVESAPSETCAPERWEVIEPDNDTE